MVTGDASSSIEGVGWGKRDPVLFLTVCVPVKCPKIKKKISVHSDLKRGGVNSAGLPCFLTIGFSPKQEEGKEKEEKRRGDALYGRSLFTVGFGGLFTSEP